MTALFCQCRDCQHDSGTGHSCHLMLPEAAFQVSGPLKFFNAVADSGSEVYRGFCTECGSSLLYGSKTFAGAIFVTAGSLDDPTWFKPEMVVYTSSAQPWDSIDETLRRFDRMPPLRRPG